MRTTRAIEGTQGDAYDPEHDVADANPAARFGTISNPMGFVRRPAPDDAAHLHELLALEHLQPPKLCAPHRRTHRRTAAASHRTCMQCIAGLLPGAGLTTSEKDMPTFPPYIAPATCRS